MIVVETLSLLLVKARELGMISGFEMGEMEKESPACNLQTIPFIFSTTKREEMVALRRILRCFQLVSGLKVNISKNVLVGVGCSEETMRELANIIQSRFDKLPILYLGLPIGAKSRSVSLWDPVSEKFERKLLS